MAGRIARRLTAPLSMANVAAELEVAHTTVKRWLEQLKRLYLVFPVAPWTRKIPRGLRKKKKWYFLDWYYAPEGAARLENITATYLFRVCLAMTDMGYGNYRLNYVRTQDKKEIDFVIARDNRPILALEVKSGDVTLSRPLKDRRKWFLNTPPGCSGGRPTGNLSGISGQHLGCQCRKAATPPNLIFTHSYFEGRS